jgi:Ni,Fe-hydrogenase III small subunit
MRRTIFDSLANPILTEPLAKAQTDEIAALAGKLDAAARARLGRSLSIREVDAGSCNGCELEINALSNAFYDLERFGLRFVASPRHADVLLVTGPVTKNMREALLRTYEATPSPKWVVAAGVGAVEKVIPVDLRIPGCPPTPTALLTGLLALMSKSTADRPR